MASERLSRSQPALSKCLQRLEESIGAPLFIRDGRGVHLTTVGEALLEKTKQLSLTVKQTEKDMRNFVRGSAGSVRIGCVPCVEGNLISTVCQRFIETNQQVNIEVVSDTDEGLWERLFNYQLDMIVTTVTKPGENVATHQITNDPVVAVAHQEHPLFERLAGGNIKAEDLLEYRWALPDTHSLIRQWVDQYFVGQRLPKPEVQIEGNSFSLLQRVVEQTHLLSFIPRRYLQTIDQSATQLKEVPVKEFMDNRQVYVAKLDNRPASPAAIKMMDMLSQNGSSLFS